MIRYHLSALIIPLILVAACSDKDDGGNVVAASSGKDGKMSINIPSISAKIALPKIRLDSDNFDIGGVKLYPGSSIRTLNVNAGKNDENDRVSLMFTAPASPASVRDYFLNAMKEKGLSVTANGDTLTGTEEDGDPFRIDLKPGSGSTTRGAIALTSK